MAYSTPERFKSFGLGNAAIDVPNVTIDEHLQAASDQADVWLELGGYTTPLSSWGLDLERAVCEIAAASMAKGNIGYNPDAGSDKLIEDRRTAARKEILMMAALGSSHLVSGP